MAELNWKASVLELPLKYTWAISRNSSDVKNNLLLQVEGSGFTGMGEAAPNVRYGESAEGLLEEFDTFLAIAPAESISLDEWCELLSSLSLRNALRMGLDAAYHDWLAGTSGLSVENLLGVADLWPYPTAYTIPIMDPATVPVFYEQHNLKRFQTLKIKINKEWGADLLNQAQRIADVPLMIDPNEGFEDVEELIRFTEKIAHPQLLFLEQPMPARLQEESIYLKKHSKLKLVADESCTDSPDWDYLSRAFHGINMKLMKAGSYRRGREILKEARRRGFFTMVGCMVESSLGIRQSLRLCPLADFIDLDGFLYLKDDPFRLLNEKDGFIFTRS